MITEDYVSFESAKRLKEMGFNGKFHKHYWGYDLSRGGFLTAGMFNPEYDYPAPTHQMTMKWLREEHNIIITMDFDNYELETQDEKVGYGYNLQLKSKPEEYEEISKSIYDTYEEAAEAAIKHCLDLLEKQEQVNRFTITQHEKETCKENNDSLTDENVLQGEQKPTRSQVWDYCSKLSHEWYQVTIDRWNTLTEEEKNKYNQYIGFNDFSDMLMNMIAGALFQLRDTGKLEYEEGSLLLEKQNDSPQQLEDPGREGQMHTKKRYKNIQ